MKKIVFSVLCLLLGVSAFAQSEVTLKRNITRAVNENNSEVALTVKWKKAVRMRDVMSRPPRMGANGNMVIRYDTKTTSCNGILTNTGYVATPAVCVQDDDFTLAEITLQFANGQRGTGHGQSFSVKEDVAYIRVRAELTRGLTGVPLAKIPTGQSLHETFGSQMTSFLVNFFNKRGIHARFCRIGHSSVKPDLHVGDAVILDGKLVALVKEVPSVYRANIFGKAPEFPLAIIY